MSKELLWKAYLAGFKRSGEGWNGGHPWRVSEERRAEIKHGLRHGYENESGFEEWYAEHVNQGDADE